LKFQKVWIGGLFTPEAYITATRQSIAQNNQWSLEELDMLIHTTDSNNDEWKKMENSFGLIGLKIQGAKCLNSKLSLDHNVCTDLPLVLLQWKKKYEITSIPNQVALPVYLNATRSESLFVANLSSSDGKVTENTFYERGVAIIASSLGN
ncbi:hypothetical protein SNEBB_007070, partial [Seison nebaliae]